MKSDHPVVGVFGHYGNHNLGDESIIEASISQVRQRLPNAEIHCLSLHPEDSARRHQVESYSIRYAADGYGPIKPEQAPNVDSMPWRIHAEKIAQGTNPDDYSTDDASIGLKDQIKRLPIIGACIKILIRTIHQAQTLKNEAGYLLNSRNYLKKFDLIVVAGSNQFLDNFGGSWQFPYTLLKWTLLAKLTGTKIAFASIGANPLEKSLSRKMIHAALRKADYLSYRDEASRDLIESNSPAFSGEIYPDLAFGLDYPPVKKIDEREKPLIAINPMPVYDYRYWCVQDDRQYKAYVAKLSRLAERLITEGYPTLFFPTMWRDEYVITDILNEMDPDIRGNIEENQLARRFDEVSELVELLQDVDIVVATRFHGTVLPLLVHTPVLSISYYRKNVDLMDAFGQSDYNEALEQCEVDTLYEKLTALTNSHAQAKTSIRSKTEEYQQLVNEQWDRIIQLIT